MSVRCCAKIVAAVALLGLGACEGVKVEEPQEYRTEQTERIRDKYGTIHGGEGILEFGGSKSAEQDGGGGGFAGIGVNAYLWRAALETVQFMPLAQADPFGGVIITDWYSPPESPGERFKLNVYILDRVLRADAVKVAVFRQTKDDSGWVDALVDSDTARGIENSILTRARELRIAALGATEG